MEITDKSLSISSERHCQMIDITPRIAQLVTQSGITAGWVNVYCPHTTAAITINENADPDVACDILLTLDEMIPQNRRGYRHIEGNSDAHVKSSLVGCSEQVTIKNGNLCLGTWQSIYFCEFDGPRNRKVFVQVHSQ